MWTSQREGATPVDLVVGGNSNMFSPSPNPHLENERTVRKLVKILSIEDASLEEDMAELRKKMDTMPANFINGMSEQA